jgi:plasmid stabilization system protein ParE
MAQVRWTGPALRDLTELAEYVSSQSAEEAADIVREAMSRADDRGQFAWNGSIVPETDNPNIREVLVKGVFRLIYRIHEDDVFVLAFLRSSRKFPKELH